jgi:ADP-ribose pyrophosphatase
VNQEVTPEEARPKTMKGSALQPWQVIKSRQVFDSPPWIRISMHDVRLPDGTVVKDYRQIELPDFVVVFAQTVDGKVIVERQYKHGIGKVSLMLPAGAIETGEDPLSAIQRELLEETGYKCDTWQPLGDFVANGNFGCGRAHLFMAQDAYRVAEPNSGDLEDMEIVLMQPAELIDSVRSGDVASLSSVTAIALATNPLFTIISKGSHSPISKGLRSLDKTPEGGFSQ